MIVASSTLGLCVNCPDIARVINWEPPTIIEELVQESGGAGRDGLQAEAILYLIKSSHNEISAAVQRYRENRLICRRSTLFSNFLFYRLNNVIPCNAVIYVLLCVTVVNVIVIKLLFMLIKIKIYDFLHTYLVIFFQSKDCNVGCGHMN